MSAMKENKAIVRRFVDEVQSRGNIAVIDELCSPKFVKYSSPPGVPSDCEGVKLVTEGDKGIPPTRQRVSISLIDIVRVADGRVVEHWSIGDNLAMM
jgi:hypothetical protein